VVLVEAIVSVAVDSAASAATTTATGAGGAHAITGMSATDD
jgi:hypothetical protein